MKRLLVASGTGDPLVFLHGASMNAYVFDDFAPAMQRYIYEGIADFAVGMKRGRIVALDDSQHNIHLVSPDVLEEVMHRRLAELREGQ